MRTVVVQVEPCELAVLVGFRPASGAQTDTLLGRIGSSPKSQMLDHAKTLLTSQAMGPLNFAIDGKPLVPTTVRAKLGVDPSGSRPLVVVLVTFAIPEGGGRLSVSSKDARSTRISWADRDSSRVELTDAPSQARWFTGVASFLLSLSPSWGASACASSRISRH